MFHVLGWQRYAAALLFLLAAMVQYLGVYLILRMNKRVKKIEENQKRCPVCLTEGESL